MAKESLILRSNKRKWLVSFLICAAIFIISLNFLNIDNSNKGILFFLSQIIGVIAIYSFFRLLPKSSYLQLDKDGLKWQSLFYKDQYSWKDVGDFSVNKFGYVVFGINEHGKQNSPLESKLPKNLQDLRSAFGNKVAFPENYGQSPQELVNILNAWKKKYSSQSHPRCGMEQ